MSKDFTEKDLCLTLHDPTVVSSQHTKKRPEVLNGVMTKFTTQDTEELAYELLVSLPRSKLAKIQRRIAPLLQFDIIGQLPTEIALQILSYLPFHTLLTCALVNHRWRMLADDQSLWKSLCHVRGWTWKDVLDARNSTSHHIPDWIDPDDEGMGDSADDREDDHGGIKNVKGGMSSAHFVGLNSLFGAGSSCSAPPLTHPQRSLPSRTGPTKAIASSSSPSRTRQGSSISRSTSLPPIKLVDVTTKPNYKLLHQTHIKLRNRFLTSSYRLSTLQTRGGPTNSHTSSIYCLQLYTYPESGKQVLFTGSRDRTVREWDLTTGMVERVISNIHSNSILTLSVYNGYLASGGSDRHVVVWNLKKHQLEKKISDHGDSVLCVRFNDRKLVSCSKDRTVRIYSFPNLRFQFVLHDHHAAVNSVSISGNVIVSASGDRSIRLWDAKTGNLLRKFDDHHKRGIAAIDFSPPIILSGSSDKHIRFFDTTTLLGWSTNPEYDTSSGLHVLPISLSPSPNSTLSSTEIAANSSGNLHDHDHRVPVASLVCKDCGSHRIEARISAVEAMNRKRGSCVHADLVRTVALGQDFVLSGSYDSTIKVWDRKTGVLVADLTGGHTGKIFCIGFDSKKIVSCGEDRRICIWDFSYGIDTRFLA